MSGWIKIHRALMANDLWLSEPFSRGQAWIDLIGLANYKDGFIRVRGNRIDLARGQCGWSEIKLSERWRWSRNKTRKFLKELEKDNKILQKKDSRTTVITICNYCIYQDGDTTDDTTDDTTEGQQKDNRRYTNKERKEEKERKEKNIGDLHHQNTLFEKFWVSYGRIGNKKRAVKAWENVQGVDFDDLLKALENYKTYAKAEMDWYQMQHASTWLANKGWEDDYITKEGLKKQMEKQRLQEKIKKYDGVKDD